MKLLKKFSIVCTCMLIFISIAWFGGERAEASVMSQQNGQIQWYTTAPRATSAGKRFSTVGWSFFVSNDINANSCYISLNEMNYTDNGDEVYYSISTEDIQRRTGVDLNVGNIFVYANARVNFHYTDSNGNWTIVYGEANNQQEADVISNEYYGHDFEGSNYFYQAVAWNHLYLTVDCGEGVTSTYGSGWYGRDTTATYGASSYAPGYHNAQEESILMDGNKTVVVNAQKIRYTIKYDANGGEDAPEDQEKIYGEDLTLSSEIPTREDYDFIAWNTKKDGSGQWFKPEALCNINDNITLYAQWKPSLRWQSTISKLDGDTFLGIGASFKTGECLKKMYNSLEKDFGNVFKVKKVTSPDGISYFTKGDMTAYVYVNVDSGCVNHLSFDFSPELNALGIADFEKNIAYEGTYGSSKYCFKFQIPANIPTKKVLSINVVATTKTFNDEVTKSSQLLKFNVLDLDTSVFKDRIRYQGGMK